MRVDVLLSWFSWGCLAFKTPGKHICQLPDHCFGDPCQNQRPCSNNADDTGFVCDCGDDYLGDTCDTTSEYNLQTSEYEKPQTSMFACLSKHINVYMIRFTYKTHPRDVHVTVSMSNVLTILSSTVLISFMAKLKVLVETQRFTYVLL